MCGGMFVTLKSAELLKWLDRYREYLVQSPPKLSFLKTKEE